MFGLLTRTRRSSVPARGRTARPTLEVLERRDAPGAVTMNVTYDPNRQVTLTGQVTGEANNAGQTVRFGGVVSGQTTTDANGNYSITLPVSALGTACAGLPADPAATAQATLTSAASLLSNFVLIDEGLGYYEVKGTITGAPFQGMAINFGGLLQGQQCGVAANGTFDQVYYLGPNANGTVSAQATDWWGDTSNTALYAVTNS